NNFYYHRVPPNCDFSVSKTGSCLTDSIMSYDIITMFQYILFIIYLIWVATVYKGNIIKNLIMDCQSYTKYRPNETTGGIFVSWRRKEELPTGA
ncbi:hypothetical protein, partial [Agathobacter rectalis]|uniref:hypothetical protein n=1 Tax=Agathobacter rectalis TaxID=39491 RepID=UPI0027D2E867